MKEAPEARKPGEAAEIYSGPRQRAQGAPEAGKHWEGRGDLFRSTAAAGKPQKTGSPGEEAEAGPDPRQRPRGRANRPGGTRPELFRTAKNNR